MIKEIKRLSYLFWYNVKRGIWWYDLKYGVRNLIRWFPVIWKDRGWDHTYIYTMLEFKLRLQSESMRKGKFIQDYEKYADQMLEVAELLKKQADTFKYYESDKYDELEKKYGVFSYEFIPTDDTNKYYTFEKFYEDGTSIPEDVDEQYSKEFSKLTKEARKRAEIDKKRAFKLISDNIEHWWW